ncbi:MAG: GDSL-type esterase/lipase family protein [Spirosomaceae bacterium]|nr:GDSL-type esterase/lipase family protein [Spirosomataceae bacterium]
MLYLFLVLLIVFFLYSRLRDKVVKHIPETFPITENRAKFQNGKPIVVCFGDSNTHGNVSYNWVADLEKNLPDFQLVNAGRNSDLTFTLLHRIEDVIACKPNFINVLIGTNDLNATFAKSSLKRYQKTGRLIEGEVPSIVSFKRNYEEIVDRLSGETQAEISLMSLPLMGENLESEENKSVAAYNSIIKEIAEKNGLIYLPLFEQQKAYLEQFPSQTKYKFSSYFYLLNLSIMKHYWFGKSWDEISRSNKTKLSPDFLHQNSISGKMIAELVSGELKNTREN